MKRNVDIVVITTVPFPTGMAPTNRILSYAKALAKKRTVKVFVTRPSDTEEAPNNHSSQGSIDNVYYRYLNNTPVWPYNRSKIVKLFYIIYAHIALAINLVKSKPKSVIVYCDDFYTRVLVLFFKYLLNYRLIIEENEYPKIIKRTNYVLIKYFQLSIYKHIDGVLTISNELYTFYKINMRTKEVFFLPMTVDIKRFERRQEYNPGYKYFIYVGGGGGFERDGIFDIVKAFAIFYKAHALYKLLIIGPISDTNLYFKEMSTFIAENCLDNSILFEGVKNTNEIPKYLQNATAIVMAPPKDFPSGGFPTKLGEFLMSETPVITTSVSEIPKYLDDHSAILVEPSNIKMLAAAMHNVTEEHQKYKAIGTEGKKVALSCFNAENHVMDLISFLEG